MTADTFFDCIYHGPFPSSQRFCPECRALRATAAENTALRARVAQLEAALDMSLHSLTVLLNDRADPPAVLMGRYEQARAALATTPADAGRRWEAMRDCTTALRALLDAPRDVQWVLAQRRAIAALDALARLDAEGKP